MASRWLSRVGVASVVVGAGLMIGAPVAWSDPPGNNGTVKINAQGVDEISNDPHVPCDFQVQFFGFDNEQTATMTFTIQEPSGKDSAPLVPPTTAVVSHDKAGGGPNDPDEIFKFSGTSFGLDRFTAQPQQGFHIKLTITSAGIPGNGVKHKVFWLQCNVTPPTTTTAPPTTTTAPPTTTTAPPTTTTTAPSTTTTAPSTTTAAPTTAPGTLPTTGARVGAMIAAGAALVAGGTALLVMRRRRDAVDDPTEL
jgi:LPXTG-motif cell wall-anchored protein